MRITQESDPSTITKVKRVLLNGKPLIGVVACDDEEGWADVSIPKTNRLKDAITSKGRANEEEAPETEWEIKRLQGEVEIIWDEQ